MFLKCGMPKKQIRIIVKYLPETDYYQAKQWDGFIQPYADSPLDDEHVGESVYMNLIAHAKKEIYFTTPYLIITDEMNRALGLGKETRGWMCGSSHRESWKKLIYKVTRSIMQDWCDRGCVFMNTHLDLFMQNSVSATGKRQPVARSIWIIAVCIFILKMGLFFVQL